MADSERIAEFRNEDLLDFYGSRRRYYLAHNTHLPTNQEANKALDKLVSVLDSGEVFHDAWLSTGTVDQLILLRRGVLKLEEVCYRDLARLLGADHDRCLSHHAPRQCCDAASADRGD